MKAAVLVKPYQLEIREVPKPVPAPGEVLIKVDVCGVCGTDVNLYTGKYTGRWPVIIGHEFAGTVAEVGEGVSIPLGTRVTADPNESCGACYWCHSGKSTFCENMAAYGVLRDGGFAEYVLVSQRGVYPTPANLDPELASFAEPVSCAVHGADQAGYRPGDTILITGDGPMGLLQTQLAAQSAPARLIVVGHHEGKLSMARQFGATDVLLSGRDDVPVAVKEATNGLGVDVAVVAVGKSEAIEQALGLVRKGGKLVIFGFPPETDQARFSPFQVLSREITIVASWVNPYTFPRAIDLLAAGKVQVAPFITHRLPLEGLPEAIAMMQRKPAGFIKALIALQ